ncbi:MAG: hypothetical protein JSS83_19460 [Cyanobacteria bacterium SZAS LIN-3]|nr:hypothetical protein [Cyanobacteria bacterium SZAS LIN-3]
MKASLPALFSKPRSVSFSVSFALVALLLMAYYAPVLFFGRELFVSDHTFYFEPFARLIAESYQHGRLPLWNPYNYCGMPQIANPSPGLFYLPNLLFVGLTYSQAMGWILIIQQMAAFAGAFLLIESIGWGLPAAMLCGVIMALNGYMMSLSANYTLPGSAAWGVLALYAVINIGRPAEKLRRPAQKYWFVVLASLSIHLTLMAGRPEVFVPVMLLVGTAAGFMLLGLIKPFPTDEPIPWRVRAGAFVWQMSALVLGIMLSAPMLLPVYEWSKLSPRASGLKLDHVFHWSVNWYDLVCMLCPQPLGDLQQPNVFLKIVTTHAKHYAFLPSALIGPVCFSLFWLGIFDKTFKARFWMLAGFAIALCTALGKYGPLSPILLKAVPFLSVLRYPCKLLIVVILFVAILAARGLNAVARERVGQKQKNFLIALWLILLAVAATLTLGDNFCAAHLNGIPASLLAKVGISLVYTSAIGLVVALLVAFGRKLKITEANLAILLVLLTAVSIFVPAIKAAPRTVAAGYYSRVPAMKKRLDEYEKTGTKSARFVCVYFDPLKVANGYEPRYPVQNGEVFMQYTRELLLPNTNSDSGVRAAFGYEASESKDYRQAFLKALHRSSADKKNASDLEVARFCQITSVKYLASQIVGDKGPVSIFNAKRFKLLFEDTPMNVRLYEVLNVSPRAYFASTYRTIKSQDEAIDALYAPSDAGTAGNGGAFDRYTMIELGQKIDPAVDLFDFSDHSAGQARAVLTGQKMPVPAFDASPVVSLSAERNDVAKVSMLRDDNENVSLSVSTPVEGFVILNDRFYPGWHAVVDTQPATMYRANGFMRAVYLSKGQHLVEFNYEPASFKYGCYAFAVAAFVLACLVAVWLKQPGAHLITYLSTGKYPGS